MADAMETPTISWRKKHVKKHANVILYVTSPRKFWESQCYRQCVLTDGEKVTHGWSGSDTGDNYCNTCDCHVRFPYLFITKHRTCTLNKLMTTEYWSKIDSSHSFCFVLDKKVSISTYSTVMNIFSFREKSCKTYRKTAFLHIQGR